MNRMYYFTGKEKQIYLTDSEVRLLNMLGSSKEDFEKQTGE